jgi:antitoxin HigA-1
MAAPAKFPPIHPGATLLEDFMKPLRLSINRLAIELRVPATRIHEIVNGQRAISVDTALRLARYFGTSPEFWLNLQQHYDLERAKDELEERVGREVHPRSMHEKRAV